MEEAPARFGGDAAQDWDMACGARSGQALKQRFEAQQLGHDRRRAVVVERLRAEPGVQVSASEPARKRDALTLMTRQASS